MADNKQSGGASELISKGASATNAVQGAVKTGKAIAGISKGAAAGGPYGAIAMALWQNRGLVLKIVLATTFLILLPILFILMLPSLIFGGLESEEFPEFSIMNDNAAIYANIENVGAKVYEVLAEQHTAVLAEIQEKIDALPDDDEHEIVDNFSKTSSLDTNILISQYCAYKDNYAEISIDDLVSIIKKHKDELFSWSETVETAEVTRQKDDEDSGAETVTIEKYIYTISFVGTKYFANEMFQLDEGKSDLARNYAENLVLFLEERDNQSLPRNDRHRNINDLIKDDTSEYPGGDFAAVIENWRAYVSSEFGTRADPFTGESSFHSGIDIAIPLGTSIYTAADGVVLYTSRSTVGYGHHIVINHGGRLTTLYSHLSEILVTDGQTVEKGDEIGKVGSTGRSTGPHLHFEVQLDGVLKNPREYLP